MDPSPIRVATLTLSDTRTPENDESGRLLGELLRAGGFTITSHAILREEPDDLRAVIFQICGSRSADAIVMTGGTGIGPRDRTIETLAPMLEKTLDGFGEMFRRLSWDEIGAGAILSRALAGAIRGRVVFALPGSPNAVRLASERLLVPVLAHAVAIASGKARQHHGHRHTKAHGGGT
jgi:molybdenum cofactor biosynthesis protein B